MTWFEWNLKQFLEFSKIKQVFFYAIASIFILWIFYLLDWAFSYQSYSSLQEQKQYFERALKERYTLISKANIYKEQKEILAHALSEQRDQWLESNEDIAHCMRLLSTAALSESLEIKSLRVLPEDKSSIGERKFEIHLSGSYSSLLKWIFQVMSFKWLIQLERFQLSTMAPQEPLQLQVILKLYQRGAL